MDLFHLVYVYEFFHDHLNSVSLQWIQIFVHFQIQNLVDDTKFWKIRQSVPIETQMLLLEGNENTVLHNEVSEPSPAGTFYVLFLPSLEGRFRTSLQGSSDNEVQLCVESGKLDACSFCSSNIVSHIIVLSYSASSKFSSLFQCVGIQVYRPVKSRKHSS